MLKLIQQKDDVLVHVSMLEKLVESERVQRLIRREAAQQLVDPGVLAVSSSSVRNRRQSWSGHRPRAHHLEIDVHKGIAVGSKAVAGPHGRMARWFSSQVFPIRRSPTRELDSNS